jgi:hypothetical protein
LRYDAFQILLPFDGQPPRFGGHLIKAIFTVNSPLWLRNSFTVQRIHKPKPVPDIRMRPFAAASSETAGMSGAIQASHNHTLGFFVGFK